MFINTASGYLSMMNSAVDGLQGFLTGAEHQNKFTLLDNKINDIGLMVVNAWEKNSWYICLLIIPFIFFYLYGFTAYAAVIILTTITLKVLLATAPLFIFCYMWAGSVKLLIIG